MLAIVALYSPSDTTLRAPAPTSASSTAAASRSLTGSRAADELRVELVDEGQSRACASTWDRRLASRKLIWRTEERPAGTAASSPRASRLAS